MFGSHDLLMAKVNTNYTKAGNWLHLQFDYNWTLRFKTWELSDMNYVFTKFNLGSSITMSLLPTQIDWWAALWWGQSANYLETSIMPLFGSTIK